MPDRRPFRLIAALACVLTLGMVAPGGAQEDTEEIRQAKEERDEVRRVQLEARIELELLAAEDLEVVAALEAATELVELQQAKVDAARQRLTAARDAHLEAVNELAWARDDIELLRDRAVVYAVESYVGLSDRRAAAWLSAEDATVAAHKVALIDALGTDTFDVLDQLRAIEERRRELLAQSQGAQVEADAIEADLADALVELEAKQAVQLELKAEVDARRERWELALAEAEREEEELTAWIKAEQARIEEELRRAREAQQAVPQAPSGIISEGGWTWPTSGGVASGFGQRLHPILGYYRMHTGMDIGGAHGQPIWAAHEGVVSLVGWNGGYGNTVVIGHGDSVTTLYAHMSGFAVGTGEYVTAGQVIGYVGSTGLSTGPHLHFEVRINGSPVNPRPYLP